ncbi:MAG: single-stranded-DNA-specific exonuclease RecJ [Armatimonadia bacterium]|nr:single-stranded-DNA-specific exonuclease RecJ [Armatimonadia bacterium]
MLASLPWLQAGGRWRPTVKLTVPPTFEYTSSNHTPEDDKNLIMASTRSSDWIIAPRDRDGDERLARELDIHPILAAILRGRGYQDASDAKSFLNPSLDGLHDPFLLPDLEPAVDRILHALDSDEPILVHGDYDADGITSAALLVRFLSTLGADVHYFLPHRFHDSYGLSERAVRQSADLAGLIIAADCGVRDHEVIDCACAQGQDVIVVDHHEPGETLPDGALIVDPKRPEAEYPERELAAVGLAFKLASGVCEKLDLSHKSLQRAFLDLVAIGTIADVAPLVGENRIMASVGLTLLPHTRKVGLQVLMELCELRDRVTAQDVAFRLGPRLNAVGRMGDPTDALELLLTDDEMEARKKALHLDSLNSQRRSEQDETFRQAVAMVEAEVDLERDRVVVLAKQGWHRGVVGIVASKVLEHTGLPTLLMAVEGPMARGSARSIDGFDVSDALGRCDDLLDRHGGHSLAAGCELDAGRVAELRDRLNEIGRARITEEILTPQVAVDAEVPLSEVNQRLARELERLEPCGAANPEPLLVARDVRVLQSRTVGAAGKHLKMLVEAGARQIDCIAFGMGDRLDEVRSDSRVDLCFVPKIDDYTGVERLQLQVADVRPST